MVQSGIKFRAVLTGSPMEIVRPRQPSATQVGVVYSAVSPIFGIPISASWHENEKASACGYLAVSSGASSLGFSEEGSDMGGTAACSTTSSGLADKVRNDTLAVSSNPTIYINYYNYMWYIILFTVYQSDTIQDPAKCLPLQSGTVNGRL